MVDWDVGINVEVGEITVGIGNGSCSTWAGSVVGAAGPHPARVSATIKKRYNQDTSFIIGFFLIK